MTVDIGKTVLRTLAAEGVALSDGCLKALQARYVRMAENTVSYHHANTMINGLRFDRNEEEQAVATFAKGLEIASECFWSNPMGIKLIPNWTRVAAAMPLFPHNSWMRWKPTILTEVPSRWRPNSRPSS